MKLALLCTQLAAEFLFNVGFRTKRNLRGPANDWVEPLIVFLSSGVRVREWFANYGLLRHPSRLSEYLLECPSPEVGGAHWVGWGYHSYVQSMRRRDYIVRCVRSEQKTVALRA